MNARDRLYGLVADLERSKASVRCQHMIDCLQRLGFEVREGKKSGHRVFVHHGIQAFRSGAFTCGHGKNPEIKPAYVTQIIRLIRRYESEFIELLEQDHDH